MFGGTDKYEDSAEKFQRAGHAYKAAKAWPQAAKAYENAAKNYQKAKSDSDVANCFIEAARAYVKAGDSKTATEVLETEALPRMVDAGRLSQAAKLHQEVAEMMEEEGQYDGAMDNYQKAADLFNAENAGSTASKCLAKIGHLAAQLDPPDFDRASIMFAQVGSDCLASNLLKFSAKGYFFNAVICTLARGDIVAAESQLNKFKEQDYTFGGACCYRCYLFSHALTLLGCPHAPHLRHAVLAWGSGHDDDCAAGAVIYLHSSYRSVTPASHHQHHPPPSCAGSRECKLLEDVCAAFKDGAVDAFTDSVYRWVLGCTSYCPARCTSHPRLSSPPAALTRSASLTHGRPVCCSR